MITKKILTTLLCSVVALGIVSGCTVKQHKDDDPSATSSTATERDRERQVYGTYAIPDTARNNQIEMMVDSVEVVTWEQVDMLNTVKRSHNLIKAHVVITNLSEEDIDLRPRDVRGFIDNEELTVTTNEAAWEALGIKGDVIEERTVHPGRSETGYILYEYYRNWVEFEVQYKDSSLDFGIKFSEDDVITLRTTIDTNTTITSETSEDPAPTGDTPTEPDTSETETQPTQTTSVEDLPGITIPAPGGN